MSMASFLKAAANLLMSVSLMRMVASDLGSELRRDAAGLGGKAEAAIRRSPYGAAGSAAAIGVLAGLLVVRHRNRPTH